jgi:hypothetical protein
MAKPAPKNLLPEELHYPAAFYDGQACFYERASRYSPSYFGGPTGIRFTGLRHGPRRLHHVMTLNWKTIPGIEEKGLSNLCLFYGMSYSGCTMTYEIVELFRYRLLELKPPKSLADWPYSGYPDLLPYLPLRVAQQVPCSPEQFRKLLIQNGEVKDNEVTVIVPPMFDLGMSLWGDSGDAEGVQIVFQVDVGKHRVRAYNECT